VRIGILALQGDFIEHQQTYESLSIPTKQVRLAADLAGIDGLVIPGGESTTIGKLAVDFGLMEPLRTFAHSHAVWGTCAGSIFLSKDARRAQPLLGLMDIRVERNAFGRQVDSFETTLNIPALQAVAPPNGPFHAVFIRAPLIEETGPQVKVLATLENGAVVAAQENQWLATSFHPELTNDNRLHRYFMELIK